MKTLWKHMAKPLIFSLTMILGCSDSGGGVSVDGFKDLKFGENTKRLESLGFVCESKYDVCKMEASRSAYTIFGQQASVTAWFTDDKLSSIKVGVKFTPDEVIKSLEESLGTPKTTDYSSLTTGQKIRRHYWVSNEGASISVVKNMDSDTVTDLFGRTVKIDFSSVEYQDKVETDKILAHAKQGTINNEDI